MEYRCKRKKRKKHQKRDREEESRWSMIAQRCVPKREKNPWSSIECVLPAQEQEDRAEETGRGASLVRTWWRTAYGASTSMRIRSPVAQSPRLTWCPSATRTRGPLPPASRVCLHPTLHGQEPCPWDARLRTLSLVAISRMGRDMRG